MSGSLTCARRNATRGFTLLEVLLATLLFGISILAIVQANVGSLRRVRQSENLFQATQLAQAKMVEQELKVQKLVNQGISTGTFTEENGTFDKPYESFTWRAKTRETSVKITGDNLKAVMKQFGVEDDDASKQIESMALLLTNLNKYIKENMAELVVVVEWQEFGRKSSLPLMTHLIPLKPKPFQPTMTAE